MLSKRLVALRGEKTQEEVAQALGISRARYAHYEQGRSAPSLDILTELADYFYVSLDYLLDRADDPTAGAVPKKRGHTSVAESRGNYSCETEAAHRKDDPMAGLPPEAKRSLEEFKEHILLKYGPADHRTGRTDNPLMGSKPSKGIKIPVLGRIQAGVPIEAVQEILDYEEITPEMASSGEFFALIIKGSSMEPKMSEGDVVIVRKQSDVTSGDTAVVIVNDHDATVKRLIKKENGIMLQATNPAHEPLYFTQNEIRDLPVVVVGRVMELRAKF